MHLKGTWRNVETMLEIVGIDAYFDAACDRVSALDIPTAS